MTSEDICPPCDVRIGCPLMRGLIAELSEEVKQKADALEADLPSPIAGLEEQFEHRLQAAKLVAQAEILDRMVTLVTQQVCVRNI